MPETGTEMGRTEGTERGAGAQGLGRPLFWSACAHVLAAAVLIAQGLGRPPAPLRAVDVVLVRAAPGGGAGAGPSAARPVASEASRRPKRARHTPPPGPAVPEAAPASAPAPEEVPPERPPPTVPPPVEGPALPEEAAPSGALRRPEAEGPEEAGEAPRAPAGPAGGKAESVAGSAAGGGEKSAPGTAGAPQTGGAGPGVGTAAAAGVLRARIQAGIVYPDEAVRRGEQGDVLLRIRVGRAGVPMEIGVVRSSGAALLDEAARRGVVRAAPLPAPPGWVEVPVRFRLR